MGLEIIRKESKMADNMWQKVKFFISGHDPEEDYEEEEEMEVTEEIIALKPVEDDRDIITDGYKRPQRSNLVDINNNSNHMKVIVYKPKKYSDAEQIVTNLKAKKPVVVNLEEVEVELARKIFNFCSGAICALDGEMRKISKEIFILAPHNVTLDAEKARDDDDEKPFDWRKD